MLSATGTLTANASYDGSGDTNLLVSGSSPLAIGATATISITVRFSPNGEAGPFNNTALASGEGPAGGPATDSSDNGTDQDPNGNGKADEIPYSGAVNGWRAQIPGSINNSFLYVNINTMNYFCCIRYYNIQLK